MHAEPRTITVCKAERVVAGQVVQQLWLGSNSGNNAQRRWQRLRVVPLPSETSVNANMPVRRRARAPRE
jgi:hypothetical protein